MCPLCLTTVALLGSAATSGGGLAALAVKKLRGRSGKTMDNASPKTRANNGEKQARAAGAVQAGK